MIALANGSKSLLVDQFGRDMPRNRIAKELAEHLPASRQRRSRLSYDAARDSDEYKNIRANVDSFDADSANDRATRLKLIWFSRYEVGSNGYYAGILASHVNAMVGKVGPALKMMSDNVQWNRFVEREWWRWCQAIQFRRKLWCMAHARVQDGESFAVMVTNPSVRHEVQLDLVLIEAEQVTTPMLPFMEPGYIDGIKFDEFGAPLWYDVLPEHPGSSHGFLNQKPKQVPASQMLHWFKMRRPGQHRGIPDCTSTLNVGAASRRWREATLGAAETAAEPSLVLETQYPPDEIDPVIPMSTLDFQKRMMVTLPNSVRMNQIRAEHPNAQYNDFSRQQISEQARPIHMPFTMASCDASDSSFASGKLDTLLYYEGADIDRKDCDDAIMDRVFFEWFREFVLAMDRRRDEEDVSDHEWDWPAHAIIDEVSHANASQTNLQTGKTTLCREYSEEGKDFQDGLVEMAEEYFGEATDENIAKVRKICVLRNTPQHAIQQVAQLLGIEAPQSKPSPAQPAIEDTQPSGAAA